MGGAYQRQQESIGGTIGGNMTDGALTPTTGTMATGDGQISDFNVVGATSGIGILKRTGSAVLKAEIQALEKLGLSKIISNPKVFTLDNQVANIKQGEEISYQATGSEGADVQFKPANLELSVTPSIIGDGNVLLDVTVKNDSVKSNPGADPSLSLIHI